MKYEWTAGQNSSRKEQAKRSLSWKRFATFYTFLQHHNEPEDKKLCNEHGSHVRPRGAPGCRYRRNKRGRNARKFYTWSRPFSIHVYRKA